MDWNDLVATKVGKKLGKMVWVCDCKTGEKNLTQVDAEGLCKRCHYYSHKMLKEDLELFLKRGKNLHAFNEGRAK